MCSVPPTCSADKFDSREILNVLVCQLGFFLPSCPQKTVALIASIRQCLAMLHLWERSLTWEERCTTPKHTFRRAQLIPEVDVHSCLERGTFHLIQCVDWVR